MGFPIRTVKKFSKILKFSPIKQAWRPYTVEGQVGGYVTVYDGLTFATVRNAGHMVPQTQPERALGTF